MPPARACSGASATVARRTRTQARGMVRSAHLSRAHEIGRWTYFSSATDTSVRSGTSEDIPAIVPLPDEDDAANRRQEQGAHDQPQVPAIDARKLRSEDGAQAVHPAREDFRLPRAPATRAIAPRCR